MLRSPQNFDTALIPQDHEKGLEVLMFEARGLFCYPVFEPFQISPFHAFRLFSAVRRAQGVLAES